MTFNEFTKQLTIQDCLILNLDEKNLSGDDIGSMLNVSRQTVFNTKKRYETILKALHTLPSEPVEYGNHDINLIVTTFQSAFGTTKTTKWDRWAAQRLYKKHGGSSIIGAIVALASHSGDKFAPSCNNVSQFEEKLPSIIKFLNSKSDEKSIEL